jgi:protoheme IX farnesyltransferase
MVLAEQGMPSLWLVLATLVGGTPRGGSANALNCYYDRDIDQVMHRTSRRPLARRTVPPRNALVFGLVLGVLATALLG